MRYPYRSARTKGGCISGQAFARGGSNSRRCVEGGREVEREERERT